MLWKKYLKYLPLPLLAAAYPLLFLYGHNASALDLGVLAFPLGASLLVTLVVYSIFCVVQRKPLIASLSVFVFILFYYLYGSIFHTLVKLNRFPVSQAILLPVVIALAFGIGMLVRRLRPAFASGVQKILLIVAGALVVFNTFAVVAPVEAQKALAGRSFTQSVHAASDPTQNKPDIYYIIFDEYAGFDSIQSYWHDNYTDVFQAFLKQNHFFVATGSRSNTINTGSEIASRLNLQAYPENLPNQVKMNAIDNNKVMQVLKANGYTTVAIDMAFQGIKADIDVQYKPSEVGGMAADAFQKTFLDTTMFNAFSASLQSNNQAAVKQRALIDYSLEKTINPGKIQSPKFVYTHILLPHEPFIYDENGNLLPPKASDDWNYYLGQHKYTTKVIEQLITRLLAQADPHNPPVIIIQSDHGARNLATKGADGTVLNRQLPNFPAADMHDILNTMYLPGFDTSQLSNNMDPMQTFVVVLNHYLNAGLTVDPTPAK